MKKEKLKAVFKCRSCGNIMISDIQKGRENPITIESLKTRGILDDHLMLCKCKDRNNKDLHLACDKLMKSGVAPSENDEIYGVADLIYVIKLNSGVIIQKPGGIISGIQN